MVIGCNRKADLQPERNLGWREMEVYIRSGKLGHAALFKAIMNLKLSALWLQSSGLDITDARLRVEFLEVRQEQ